MSGLLFSIGLAGVMLRGNIIIILMSLEMMLSAANLALVSFWRFGGGGGLPSDSYSPQVMVFFVIMTGLMKLQKSMDFILSKMLQNPLVQDIKTKCQGL